MICKDCVYYWYGTCKPNTNPDRCDGCFFYTPKCSKFYSDCESYKECKPEDKIGGCEGCPEYEEHVNELREKENNMIKVDCANEPIKPINANCTTEANMPAKCIQSNLIDIKEQLNNTESILDYIFRFLVADKGETANPPDKEINDMLTHVSEMSSQAERIYKKAHAIAGVLGC